MIQVDHALNFFKGKKLMSGLDNQEDATILHRCDDAGGHGSDDDDDGDDKEKNDNWLLLQRKIPDGWRRWTSVGIIWKPRASPSGAKITFVSLPT